MADLTEREVDVVYYLSYGLSNAEIGEVLYLSVDTIRSHLKRIGVKLDASTRAGIVGAAYRTGQVRDD